MPLLVLVFIVVPLIELFVIIEVGGLIGVLPTIALLLAFSLLGAVLVASQGRAAWVRFRRALSEGRMPHKEVIDGALVIFGGALLLTPGFITDGVGFLCLIPPTRAGIRRLLSGLVLGRLATGGRVAAWGFGRYRERGRRRAEGGAGAGGEYDVEGTAHEVGDSAPPQAGSDDAALPAPDRTEGSERP